MPAVEKLASVNGSPVAPPPNLRILLTVHAVVTFAAAVVLIAAPALILSAVGASIEPGAYLVCYLLAAAELNIAALSWGARTLSDARAVRVIVTAFIVLHAASAVLEAYAFAANAASAAIWGNIAVRAAIVFLFAYYGFYPRNLWKQQSKRM